MSANYVFMQMTSGGRVRNRQNGQEYGCKQPEDENPPTPAMAKDNGALTGLFRRVGFGPVRRLGYAFV